MFFVPFFFFLMAANMRALLGRMFIFPFHIQFRCVFLPSQLELGLNNKRECLTPLVVRTSHWFSCGPSGGWVHRSLSFSSTCEQRFTWWNNWENRITITLTTNTESKLHLHALYKAIFPGGFILIRSLTFVTSTPYFETWMAGRLVTCLSPRQSGIRLPCVGRLHLRR